MRWFTVSFIVSTLLLTLGFAPSAQAAPEMFAASFVIHAWGNDISSGTVPPYTSNDWTAVPLGYDCQHASPTTVYDPRYCTAYKRRKGHPAVGRTTTPYGQAVAPPRSIGSGTPPKITMQQSDFAVSGVTGFRPAATHHTTPPYIQSFTYATFVNAAGSFFAGGGPAAYGSVTKSGKGSRAGTWRILPGKNAFGGIMGLQGLLGAIMQVGGYDHYNSWTYIATGYRVNAVGRPYKATQIATGTMGTPWYQNPYTKTVEATWMRCATFYCHFSKTDIRVIHSGTLFTTGQVGVMVGCSSKNPIPVRAWRTGYDNRDASGFGRIQLVTPMLTHWLGVGFNRHTAKVGILTIQVPEPWSVALLITGLATLCGLYRLRQR